jgi:hypothetical protein
MPQPRNILVTIKKLFKNKYIGINDCNGKKIYCGDTLEVTIKEESEIYKTTGIVKFNNNKAKFVVKIKPIDMLHFKELDFIDGFNSPQGGYSINYKFIFKRMISK